MTKSKRRIVFQCPKCGETLKKLKKNPNSMRCKNCKEIFDEGNLIKFPRKRDKAKRYTNDLTSFFVLLNSNKQKKYASNPMKKS